MATRKEIIRDYQPADWSRFISISDAAVEYNRAERTLRHNITNGLFVEGVDCVKFGKVWIFDRKVLDKYYKNQD